MAETTITIIANVKSCLPIISFLHSSRNPDAPYQKFITNEFLTNPSFADYDYLIQLPWDCHTTDDTHSSCSIGITPAAIITTFIDCDLQNLQFKRDSHARITASITPDSEKMQHYLKQLYWNES